jgi:hypothetical protein
VLMANVWNHQLCSASTANVKKAMFAKVEDVFLTHAPVFCVRMGRYAWRGSVLLRVVRKGMYARREGV